VLGALVQPEFGTEGSVARLGIGPGTLLGPSACSAAGILDKRRQRCYMVFEAEAGGFPRFFQPDQLPGVRWQSGDAADCKSAYAGSIPARTSNAATYLLLFDCLTDRSATLRKRLPIPLVSFVVALQSNVSIAVPAKRPDLRCEFTARDLASSDASDRRYFVRGASGLKRGAARTRVFDQPGAVRAWNAAVAG
jgi:hypothetical protein